MKKGSFQAGKAILDMRLQRLTGLERQKILEEYRDILEEIAVLDLNTLSPLEAWQKLQEIQEKIENKD